jgi:hypothetical protein
MTENPNEGQNDPEPPEPDKGEESGHAVYDKTARRFVTGVHPTAKAAREAASKVEGHSYEVREV